MRLAMQAIWHHLDKGYDIVIIARPFLIRKEQEKVFKDFEFLFKKHRIVSSK